MATTWIALLRGINVGRAKRVSMADLRSAIDSLGGRNVRTLLNSGNVIFESTSKSAENLSKRIGDAVAAQSGVTASVIVITAAELSDALDENPLAAMATDTSRFLVAVLKNPADRVRLQSLAQDDWSPDAFAVGRRVGYLWCPDGILTSKLVERVGRELGDGVTTRNLATMTKLLAMSAPLPV